LVKSIILNSDSEFRLLILIPIRIQIQAALKGCPTQPGYGRDHHQVEFRIGMVTNPNPNENPNLYSEFRIRIQNDMIG
jgi:hypothetical protein